MDGRDNTTTSMNNICNNILRGGNLLPATVNMDIEYVTDDNDEDKKYRATFTIEEIK